MWPAAAAASQMSVVITINIQPTVRNSTERFSIDWARLIFGRCARLDIGSPSALKPGAGPRGVIIAWDGGRRNCPPDAHKKSPAPTRRAFLRIRKTLEPV